MAHRLIMQVVITGSQVFGRAFSEAYKQAAGAARQSSAAAKKQTGGLSSEEACKILGINREQISKDQIDKKYDYLFDVNSKEKSGSFYLQSKVYRARERLMADLEPSKPKASSSPPPAQ